MLHQLRNKTLKVNGRALSGEHARVYMYKDGLYDSSRPLDGLFQGQLVLMVRFLPRMIFDANSL